MLAVMGAVTAITMMVITAAVTMIWMAAQGYAICITGVWLTITPIRPYQREPDDVMALN